MEVFREPKNFSNQNFKGEMSYAAEHRFDFD